MNVQCTITPDDLLAFTKHVANSNPFFRRSYLGGYAAGPVLGGLLLLVTGHEGPVGSVLKVVAPIVVFSAFYAHFYRSQLKNSARQLYGSDEAGGPLGPRTITISRDGILEETPHTRTTEKWSGIKRVSETPEAVYFFNSAASAYIVPKRAVDDDQLRSVLKAVNEYRSSAEP